jgi:hypothetical protein
MGVCPECGLPIADSVSSRFVAPESLGEQLWQVGILAGLTGLVVATLLEPWLGREFGPTEYARTLGLLRAVAIVLSFITIVVRAICRRWGMRLIGLVALTLFLLIPTCHDLTVTY